MFDFEKEILDAGTLEITDREVTFAGGDKANNHLNLDKLEKYPELLHKVTEQMAYLILAHNCNVEFLAPIPSGGDILADMIAGHLNREGVDDIPVVKFEKIDNGMFSIKDEMAESITEGVVIDDASTRLSSLERFIQTPELSGKNLSFCAIWRRGNPEIELEIPIQKYWVVEKQIPFFITKDSEFSEFTRSKK